jgi:hypothetical protein
MLPVMQELDSRDQRGGAGAGAAPHHAPAVQMIQTGAAPLGYNSTCHMTC